MRSTTVIQRVRQILVEGSTTSTQDGAAISESYAALCKQANERLRGCVDCLKRGMVSEALRIAETEPLLLDLCGDLDFVGVENWLSLCAQRKWDKAETIDAKAIQSLNEVYSSGQALEPLLKEYRRAVRERKTKECVRLLRHIANLDKANPNWVSDLKGFEERRLTEIKSEYEVAKFAEDAETLAALMVEINDDWKIPRDQALRDAVRDAARAVYVKQAMVLGRTRLQEVAQAYAAMDFEHLSLASEVYEALLREGYLKPDAAMITQFDEAKEWLQQEAKRRAEEQLYTETLKKLLVAVEQGDAKPLDEILNTLSRFDRPIPDRLEERAHALIETHCFAMERVRKRKMATAAIVLILVATGITAIVFRQRHEAVKVQLLGALTATYEAEDIENLRKLLVSTEKDSPRLFRDPEIQTWMQKKTRLESLLDKKRTAFSGIISRLTSIRDEGFKQSSEVVEGLIAEARVNVTPGAPQGQFASFLREWGSHNDALQAESDRKVSAQIDEVALALEVLIRNSAKTKDKYLAVREKGRLVDQSLENTSPQQKARLTALLGRLDSLIGELDGKERQLSLIRDARTLREYLDALKTYSRAFPKDSLANSAGGVLAQESVFVQLLDAPAGCASNNPFWFVAYRQRETQSANIQEKWPAIKTRLMDLGIEKRFTDLWECDSWKMGKVFIEGKPASVYQNNIKMCEGMVYIPKVSDIQPDFKMQTFDPGEVSRASLMPHCDFVQGLVSMARFSNSSKACDDIVGAMQKLATNSNISALLKLRIMEILLGSLTELVGVENASEWNALRRDINSIDSDLHWLCFLHRDVKIANEKAEAILKRYFSSAILINQSRFMREVRDVSLNRNVKWVAYAGLTNASQVVWKSNAYTGELWVVRSSEGGSPQIVLAAENGAKGLTHYTKYNPGEPLFAPTDGRSTRDILSSLKQKCDLRETKHLKWANSWPVNFCQ